MSKPDWKDAPKWAMWLAQDEDGDWTWWKSKPTYEEDQETYWMPSKEACENMAGGFKTEIRIESNQNPSWKETLEQRP